jgi:hypothetical protein
MLGNAHASRTAFEGKALAPISSGLKRAMLMSALSRPFDPLGFSRTHVGHRTLGVRLRARQHARSGVGEVGMAPGCGGPSPSQRQTPAGERPGPARGPAASLLGTTAESRAGREPLVPHGGKDRASSPHRSTRGAAGGLRVAVEGASPASLCTPP